jgi:aminopeptidase N
MKESQGKTVYLRDYREPDYLIDETELDVRLFEDHTLVRARLRLRRNPEGQGAGAPLVDANCTGTAIRDFISIADARAFDEDLVQSIYGPPPADALLVFGAAAKK